MTPDRLARPALAAATVAFVALLAGAITVAADSPAPGSPTASGGDEIQIVQKTFQPSTLTVHTGDTVTWTVTQAIGESHSVTSGTYKDQSTWTAFDSGITLKNDGDSFSHTFTAAGTYSFFCQVHPDTMSGVITVVDASGASGGGSEEGGIPTENKLLAGGILVVALLLFFGWAALYRRMNPGP